MIFILGFITLYLGIRLLQSYQAERQVECYRCGKWVTIEKNRCPKCKFQETDW